MLSHERQAIVEEALSWNGTPYVHRQRCKLVGTDCVGFPLGVCINLGLVPATVEIPYYSVQWHMHQREELLLKTIMQFGCQEKPFASMLPGDLLVFKIGFVCSHTGILLENNMFVHAFCPYPSQVMERPFDGIWKQKLAKKVFLLPGIVD
jgi:cell wall-associated NlpC family hydrolase